MAKPKKKLTPAQRAEKKRRKLLFKFVFINGKQVRVKREPQIDGMDVDEFVRRNADPVWLHQNELWEYIVPETENENERFFNMAKENNPVPETQKAKKSKDIFEMCYFR